MWDRDYNANKDAYIKLFDQCMSSNQDMVSKLQQRICDYTNRTYAVAVNSATDGLLYSLLAYGIGPGDDVIVSDFSWISSASCITMAGANCIFGDIDSDSYHITLDQIKRKCTVNTKALIYTHLFGNMSDTSEIVQFCKDNDIVLIEDAAQSLGSSLNGIKAGSIGDVSSFSFNDNKVIAGISGGGIVMTDDYDKYVYIEKLKRHGRNQFGESEFLGYNSQMYNLNAAVINYRMDMLDQWQYKRQSIAQQYNEELSDLDVHIQLPGEQQVHNYHKYTVRFQDQETRDRVCDQLKLSIHYPRTISENIMYDLEPQPNAKHVSNTILTLPNHPYMNDQEIEKILTYMSMI